MLPIVPFWMRPDKTDRLTSLNLMFMVTEEATIVMITNRDRFILNIGFQYFDFIGYFTL